MLFDSSGMRTFSVEARLCVLVCSSVVLLARQALLEVVDQVAPRLP